MKVYLPINPIIIKMVGENLLEIKTTIYSVCLTHLSLASLLWDVANSRAPEGVPSGAILFAQRNFIEKWKILKSHLKVDSPN